MRQPGEDFAAYVRARQGALLRSATLFAGDVHAAQDLLQEAFTKLALNWNDVRDNRPDAYVRTILYRDSVSRWRRLRREVPRGEWADSERIHGAADQPLLDESYVSGAEVRHALQQLTAKQRAVLVLRYYDDLSEADIADTLGVSRGTVKSQAYAGLRRLRELLPRAAEVLAGAEEDKR